MKILFIYIVGYLINLLLNKTLRKVCKDTRLIENGHEEYNMPSGHSQGVFYSFVFICIFLLYYRNNTKNKIIINLFILLFYTFISFNTVFNCVVMKYHTIDQVIVGSIIGSSMSFLIFYIFWKMKFERK
jgi:membrane-associated phospholipid phosphatase